MKLLSYMIILPKLINYPLMLPFYAFVQKINAAGIFDVQKT